MKTRLALLTLLWVYEAIVISACLFAGYKIATEGGGSGLLAIPIVLIAAAELMRIPLAGWAVHLRFGGKCLAAVVMLMIAVGSFEGLVLVFERAVTNRVANVSVAQRNLYIAQTALREKQAAIASQQSRIDAARAELASVNNLIDTAEKTKSTVGAGVSRTCNTQTGDCRSERQRQENLTRSQRQYGSLMETYLANRKQAQDRIDTLDAEMRALSAKAEIAAVSKAQTSLTSEYASSTMHRTTAAIFGVPITSITEAQFETVKKWAVVGLAGAFSILSMVVSIVAHLPPSDGKPSKLSRSIRAYFIRKRRGTLITKTVEVVTEVPVEVIRIKYVPVSARGYEKEMSDENHARSA
jgi:hypothetical protein